MNSLSSLSRLRGNYFLAMILKSYSMVLDYSTCSLFNTRFLPCSPELSTGVDNYVKERF